MFNLSFSLSHPLAVTFIQSLATWISPLFFSRSKKGYEKKITQQTILWKYIYKKTSFFFESPLSFEVWWSKPDWIRFEQGEGGWKQQGESWLQVASFLTYAFFLYIYSLFSCSIIDDLIWLKGKGLRVICLVSSSKKGNAVELNLVEVVMVISFQEKKTWRKGAGF